MQLTWVRHSILIVFLFYFLPVRASGPILIGKQQGLMDLTINMTVQDKDNYLWIGSNKGLYRFDGRKSEKCSNSYLGKANISSGYLDKKGFLWIGTYEGLIFIFDGLVFKQINTPASIQSTILEFHENAEGKILAISRLNGIVEFNSHSNFRQHLVGEEKFLIYSYCQLKHNKALIGTDSGLKIIDLNTQALRPEAVPILEDIKINQVIPRLDGGFWVATDDDGVYQIDLYPKPTIISHLGKENQFPQHVNRISEDGKLLWIGTKSDGVVRANFGYRKNSLINIDYFSSGDKWNNPTVTNIFIDREGNTWLSTFNHGILKFENEIFGVFYGQGKLVDANVTCIERDELDNFWAGTSTGVFQMNFNDARWKINDLASLNLLPEDRINCLELDGTILWIGTSQNGLFRFDIKSYSSKRIQLGSGNLVNSIKCIEKTGENEFWIGTSDGIFVLDDRGALKQKITTEDGLPHNSINDLEATKDGRIWIASAENKVAYYEGKQIKQVKNQKFEISNINSICTDDKGQIWFASLGYGVFNYDGIHFERYSQKDGLASDYCYKIQNDINGRIWVSHQKGLSSIDPKKNRLVSYYGSLGNSSFDFSVNSFFKGNKTIWLCTDIGVLRYSEKNEKLARQEPKILIHFAQADSTNYDPRRTIKLPYGAHSLSIHFISPYLKNPEAIRYKFMLKGYDKGWSDVTPINLAFYSSLYDGNYEFVVKACNEYGVWTTEPASLVIIIKKPFFKEWWFYLLVVTSFIMGIYLYIHYRTNKLLKDKLKLEEVVRIRTEELELRNQEIIENKNEIEKNAKNITDSIKYAKRIQKAIYPTTSQFKKLLPESFIFFKSKGIVSGDFYWIEEKGNKVLFAACDCTGHGVPGAFISIVTNNLLNQAVKEHGITKPSIILDEVNKGITSTLHQTLEDSTVKDGMDAALCCLDKSTGTLEFAGAYNGLYLIRKGELLEFKADNIPIGRFIGEAYKTFTNHEIITQPDDVIYLFSDGFADQFGGPEGKKIKKSNFKRLLLEIWSLPMEEQREKLYNFFKSWQGELEQVDDVLVIGVRIKNF